MLKIECSEHNLHLSIPTLEKEFQLQDIHENIITLQKHHEEFPDCKFQEVQTS